MDMRRFLRVAAAPLVFIAAGLIAWFAAHQLRHWGHQGARDACVAPMPQAAQAASPGSTARVVTGDSLASFPPTSPAVAGGSLGGAAARDAETEGHAVLAAGRPEAAVTSQVRLLDGGIGARPESAMNCTFDGGFQCGECTHDSECPSGQGCAINRSTGRFECISSECEDDQGCFPGTVCRALTRTAAGGLVRRCVIEGARQEGQSCILAPASASAACREDLVCFVGACRARCEPGAAGACPAGQRCQEALGNGTVCVPDCRDSGCRAGQTCLQAFAGSYQCATLGIDECGNERPCPAGAHCLVRARGEQAGRYCASACKPWLGSKACPDGYVCGRGGPEKSSCYRQCSPQDLSSCPSGWTCTTVSEDLRTWGCQPTVSL